MSKHLSEPLTCGLCRSEPMAVDFGDVDSPDGKRTIEYRCDQDEETPKDEECPLTRQYYDLKDWNNLNAAIFAVRNAAYKAGRDEA